MDITPNTESIPATVALAQVINNLQCIVEQAKIDQVVVSFDSWNWQTYVQWSYEDGVKKSLTFDADDAAEEIAATAIVSMRMDK